MSKYDLCITVTFCNQDQYIENTLRNLLQLLETSEYSIQVLVGLDYPSEEAKHIANSFKRDNLQVFELFSNEDLIPLSRASENRFFLLKNADSEFALILDGDDWYVETPDDAINFLRKEQSFVGYAYNHKVYNERTHEVDSYPPL